MEGTLDERSVPEVLRTLHASGESGILHLSRENTTKRVFFKDGAIVFASSSASDEWLGRRLVREGTLKESELALALQVTASSHLRLGTTLVEMGHLTPQSLDEEIKRQVSSILYSVLPWDGGAFRTEEIEDPVDADLVRRDLSLENILLEGIRRIESADVIRRSMEHVDGPLTCTVDVSKLPPELRLTAEEGFVLSRVDGVTGAAEIAAVSPLGEEQTRRCVYALLAAGLLRAAGRRAAEMPVPGHEREPELEKVPVPFSLSSEENCFVDEMREKHRRASRSTFYELLDVGRGASSEEIRAAYFRIVKRLHPDHRAGLRIPDAEGVFDALYLAVKDAYEVLSDEDSRRKYDAELGPLEPSPDRRPEPVPAKSVTQKTAFTPTESARVHFANGERFFRAGRYHEAVEELRSAVRIDPSRAGYHHLLGRALAKNPRWKKQAEDHFWKAIQRNRFDAKSYLELGELYEQSGLETRARKMFEEALGVDPDNERALEKLAGSHGVTSTLGRLKGLFHSGRE